MLGKIRNRRNILLAIGGMALLESFMLIGRYTYALKDVARPHPGFAENFYMAQLLSILQGKLSVTPSDIPSECFYVAADCFGYYGVGPSILRLPFFFIDRLLPTGITYGWSSLFVFASIALIIFCSLFFIDFFWSLAVKNQLKNANFYFIVAAIAVGPGTLALQVARPAVYEEAIAWASGFALLAMVFVLMWIKTSRMSFAIGSILALCFAALSRPNGMIFSFTLATCIFIFAPRISGISARLRFFAVCAGVIPNVIASAVIYFKFKTFFPSLALNEQVPEAAHWASIWDKNGGKSFSIDFIPTNFYAYFRADGISIQTPSGTWPTIHLQDPGASFFWLPPLVPGSLYVEPVASLLALCPVLILCIGAVVYNLFGRKNVSSSLESKLLNILLLAGASNIFLTLVSVSVSNRYLGDFIPMVVPTLVAGAYAFTTSRGLGSRASVKTSFLLLATLGVITSSSVQLSLG